MLLSINSNQHIFLKQQSKRILCHQSSVITSKNVAWSLLSGLAVDDEASFECEALSIECNNYSRFTKSTQIVALTAYGEFTWFHMHPLNFISKYTPQKNLKVHIIYAQKSYSFRLGLNCFLRHLIQRIKLSPCGFPNIDKIN